MEGPRHPTPNELPSLSTLLDKTFRAKRLESGEKDVMLREYPQLVNPENLGHLWVFADSGRIASHVGVFPRSMVIEGCQTGSAAIGAVATYPEYRGQGLASKLMSAAIQQAVAEGRPVMPISGGRGLYTRIGAVDCPRTVKFVINRQMAAKLADSDTVLRDATPADLPAIQMLYRTEATRYVRLPVDYQRAFDIQFVMNSPSKFKLVFRRGATQPCAYLILQARFHGQEPTLWIFESAGDKCAVLGALEALFKSEPAERLGCQAFCWFATPHETGLASRLQAAGAGGTPDGTGGTVLLTDPVRFLKDLGPYQAERLGTQTRLELSISGEQATFRVTDATWSCPAVEVSRVLLGSVANDPPARKVENAAVAEVLAALTPIPIPHYGVSYV